MQHAALMPSVFKTLYLIEFCLKYAEENGFDFLWGVEETHGAVYERKRPQNPRVSHGLSEI